MGSSHLAFHDHDCCLGFGQGGHAILLYLLPSVHHIPTGLSQRAMSEMHSVVQETLAGATASAHNFSNVAWLHIVLVCFIIFRCEVSFMSPL